MKYLRFFILVSLIVITACVLIGDNGVHKHFVLEKSDFKLNIANQPSQESQTSVLFKLGEKISSDNSRITKITETEELASVSEEVSIIPSDIFTSSLISKKSTKNTTKKNRISKNKRETIANNETNVSTDYINDRELMQKVADMLNKNQISAGEIRDTIAKIQENERSGQAYQSKSKPNTSVAGLSSGGRNIDNSSDEACPACDMLNNSRYKNDTIAWNIWRSNIQNRIMDDSAVDANYGAIFFFSFKVDKDRNISNIRVTCTDRSDHYSVEAVRSAIKNLNGKKILEYPTGTKRKVVDFTGGFLIGDYAQYSSPSDYNDYEHVRFRY